jgi:DNA repair exonuclease SbcCD ATPase subunit
MTDKIKIKYNKELDKLNKDLEKLNIQLIKVQNDNVKINETLIKTSDDVKKKTSGTKIKQQLEEKEKKLQIKSQDLIISINSYNQQIDIIKSQIINIEAKIKQVDSDTELKKEKMNDNFLKTLMPIIKEPINNMIIQYQVLNNDNKIIQNIIHMADIHIQLNNHHEEYKIVFEKLYMELNEYKLLNPLTIICICGDILDTKDKLNPDTIILTRYFLKKLSSIFPTFIIAGNHDIVEHNKDKICSISAVLDMEQTTNIYYLKYSGVYVYNNIIFGVSSLIDNYILGIDEVNQILLSNNHVITENMRKIGLYHGYFSGVVLNNNMKLYNRKISLEQLGNYDLILLGDIHKFQYLNKQKTIAYPSSLLSHNFSETDDKHGYLEWNILNSESIFHQLANDNAYHQININKLIDYVKSKKDDIILNSLSITTELYFKSGYLRIDYPDGLNIIQSKIIEQIHNIYPQLIITFSIKTDQINNITTDDNTNTNTNTDTNANEQISNLINSSININNTISIDELIISYIKDNYNYLTQDTIDKILNYLNIATDSISKEKLQYVKSDWKIIWLNFDYMYGYGPYNIIDFTKYPMKEIIGIFGNNAIGKSSILDIITYMLFSRTPRDNSNELPKDIININSPQYIARGLMIIESNNKLYLIKRVCYRIERHKRAGQIEIKHTLELYQLIDNDNESETKKNLYDFNGKTYFKKNITSTDRVSTDKLLVPLIGTYDNFISSSILLQGNDCTFKSKTQEEKKTFMCEILKINHLTDAYLTINSKVSELKKEIKFYENNIIKISDKSISELSEYNRLLENTIIDDKIIIDKITILEEQIDNINRQIINIDLNKYKIKNNSDLIANNKLLLEKEKKLNSINELVLVANDRLIDIEIKIGHFKTLNNQDKIRSDYEFMLNQHKQEQNQILSKIRTLNTQRKDLLLNKVNDTLDIINNKLNSKNIEIKSISEQIIKLELELDLENKQILNIGDIDFLINRKSQIKLIHIPNDLIIEDINDLEIELYNIEQFINNPDTIKKNNSITKITSDYKQFIDSNTDLVYIKLNNLKIIRDTDEFNNEIEQIIDTLDIILTKNKKTKGKIQKAYDSIIKFKIEYDDNLNKYNKLVEKITNNKQIILNYEKNKLAEVEIKKIDLEIDKHKKITKLLVELKNQNQLHKESKEYIEKLKNNIELINQNQKIMEQIIEIDTQILSLEQLLQNQNTNNDAHNQYKLLEEELQQEHKYREQIMDLNNKKLIINELNNNIKDISININDYEQMIIINTNNKSLNIELDDLKSQIKNLKLELNELNQKKNDNQYKIIHNQDIIERLTEQKQTLVKIKNDFEFYDVLKNICGINGLQLYLLKQYLDKINTKINNILEPFINKKINLVLNENSKIDIQILSNEQIIYKLSGMESLMLDIVFKIIISQISLLPKSNFIFIDESISVLDKNRMDDINSFFDFLKRHYHNVYLITHMQQIKNNINYFLDIKKYNDLSLIYNIASEYTETKQIMNIPAMLNNIHEQLDDIVIVSKNKTSKNKIV